MASSESTGTIADLERLRLVLEENVEKLRRSLRHWQTWEAEYEGLKEELENLPQDASQQDMTAAGDSFGGDLVNGKDVQQNVNTVQKQLDAAEAKLERVLVVSRPDALDEDGLPLTEIHEELDDDGNVISSTVTHPGDSAPQVVEVLKKAGVGEKDLLEIADSASTQTPGLLNSKSADISQLPKKPNTTNTSIVPEDQTAPVQTADVANEKSSKPPKKSVSFAEDANEDVSESTRSENTNTATRYGGASSLADFVKGSFNRGDRVLELNDDHEVINTAPVMPVDESPEDAALRREMLEYSMAEVGSVVAQIDLEERGSQTSFSEDEDFGLEDLGSNSSAEDEDQYGMSRKSGIDDRYRAEMLALEKKLGAQSLENVGPRPGLDLNKPLREAPEPTSKNVRFAEQIDIASLQPPEHKLGLPGSAKKDFQTPGMRAAVIERSTRPADTRATPNTTTTPPRVSRFKAARHSAASASINPRPREPPEVLVPDPPQATSSTTKPSNPTHLDTVVERPPPTKPHQSVIPPESTTHPDPSIDDSIDNEEYATNSSHGFMEMEPFHRRKISLVKAAHSRKAGDPPAP